MIVSVQLRGEAERDIEEAARWYEQQREGLGYEFLTANPLPSLAAAEHRRYQAMRQAARERKAHRFL